MNTFRRLSLLLTIIVATTLLLADTVNLPSKRVHAFVPTDSSLVALQVANKKVTPLNKHKKPSYRGDLDDFMVKLATIESDNDPRAVNRFGMMGKYQFSPRTLRLMGFKMTKEEFLNNEELQDSALVAYMKENRRILNRIIRKYENTYVNGVYVTRSGILASAHLTGHGGVWAFFDPENHSYATADANGTSVEMYMKKFANYYIGF